jgi:hypothetical protein
VSDFYRVVDDGIGCEHCGSGKHWTIVHGEGKDETGVGQSWRDKETAEDICELMNQARRWRSVLHPPAAASRPESTATHFILVEPWAVYVKEANFFRSQGGHKEPWGQKWRPVTADSIEAARAIGEAQRRAR